LFCFVFFFFGGKWGGVASSNISELSHV